MASLSRSLGHLSRVLAVMAAIAVAAGPRVEAGIVQISDFNNPGSPPTSIFIATGSAWLWDQQDRELGVALNTSADYMEGNIVSGNSPDIVGAQFMRLTGAWTPEPSVPNGEFIVALYFEGNLKASALYRFGDFAGGQTVIKSLTWATNPANTIVDQWQIIGNGNSDQAFGDLVLTNMSVSTSAAVPEIDPGSASAALAVLFGSLGLVERNRRRLPIARRGATAAA